MFFSAENVVATNHPKVLRARNGILPEGIMRRIEALVRAAEAEHPDDELKQLLRNLLPDFRPHPTAPLAPLEAESNEVIQKQATTRESPPMHIVPREGSSSEIRA